MIDPATATVNVFTLRAHPAAELLPMLSDDELAQLADDIRVNGQRDPILVWMDADGRTWLLDGRNRREACKLAGVEPQVVFNTGSEISDPQAFVLSKNVLRRNLTQAQRAMAIVMLGDNNLSVRKLAEESGTSRELVRQAKLIHGHDQRLAAQVLRNEVPIARAYWSISDASKPVIEPTPQQQRVAKEVREAHKKPRKPLETLDPAEREEEAATKDDDPDFRRTIGAFGMLASIETDPYSMVVNHGDPWTWRHFQKAKQFIDDLLDSVD